MPTIKQISEAAKARTHWTNQLAALDALIERRCTCVQLSDGDRFSFTYWDASLASSVAATIRDSIVAKRDQYDAQLDAWGITDSDAEEAE